MSALAFAHAIGTSEFDRGESPFEKPKRRATVGSPKYHAYEDLFAFHDDLLSDFKSLSGADTCSYASRIPAYAWPDELDRTKSLRPWVSEMLAAGSLVVGSLVCTLPAAANDHTKLSHWASEVVSPIRARQPFSITGQLERLRDGWAGAESVAPSEQTIADVAAVALAFDRVIVEPLIEVDDDGTVALEWFTAGEVLCLTFVGDGTVIGTISPRSVDYPGWKVEARDELSVADYMSDVRVKSFVRPA